MLRSPPLAGIPPIPNPDDSNLDSKKIGIISFRFVQTHNTVDLIWPQEQGINTHRKLVRPRDLGIRNLCRTKKGLHVANLATGQLLQCG